jgi:hypothetical protein
MALKKGFEIEKLYAVQFMLDRYRLYPVAVDDSEFMLSLNVAHEE